MFCPSLYIEYEVKRLNFKLPNCFINLLFSPFSEDKGTFGQLADAIRTNYNERFDEIRRTWGGGIMGIKARNAKAKIEKLKARELAQKM